MKTIARILAFAATVVFASVHQIGYAQSRVQFLRADVPFSFESGSTGLGAGIYTIDMQHSKILLLRGHGQSMMTMAHTEVNQSAPRRYRLVFLKYGDNYLLDQVWASNDGTYLQLEHSKKRIRRLKELAASDDAPSRVELGLQAVSTESAGN
jgi:hypothetical protein